MNKQKQPVAMPVCPFCKSTMTPKYFTGYYESFSMWKCNCKKIPRAEAVFGSYAY